MRGTELVCAERSYYARNRDAICGDYVPRGRGGNKLFLLSPQKLPGSRFAPMSQPTRFLYFTSKASRVAFHTDVASNKLFFFSPQKLPGLRFAPMSHPTSYSSFHFKSFPGRVSPRCRIQQAILLFTSKASRVAFRSDVAPGHVTEQQFAAVTCPAAEEAATRTRNRAAIRRCYVPCGRGSHHPGT